MQRFFVHSKNISDNRLIISDRQEVHHIKDVLRFQVNNEIVTFDEKGNVYHSFITEISPYHITAKIKTKKNMRLPREKATITVACALPKKSKMDEIVDRLTQLGVKRIIPLLTKRVIIKLDKNKEASRLKRWEKIARNASQQNQGMRLPVIEPIKDFKLLLSGGIKDFDLKLIATLTGSRRRLLKEILEETTPKNILVLIGPEGDFTPEEIDLARKAGFVPVSLGDLVLRVDTAAIAVASYIRLSLV